MIRQSSRSAGSSSGVLQSATVTFTLLLVTLLTIGLLIRLTNEALLVRKTLGSMTVPSPVPQYLLWHLDLVAIYARLLVAAIVCLWGLSSRRLLGFASPLIGVIYMAFEQFAWTLAANRY